MKFIPSSIIPDIILIEPQVFGDERGFFMETYQARRFAEAGIGSPGQHPRCDLVNDGGFVQDNHSRSRQHTLRGLHYQIRQTQGKLVRTILGEIFDVAVDIRRHSPTFGRWVGFMLSAENKQQLWIPSGFAHGFYVISEFAEIVYKTTDFYAPEWERTILWNDPALGISWPIPAGQAPLLSAKDSRGKVLSEAEVFDV